MSRLSVAVFLMMCSCLVSGYMFYASLEGSNAIAQDTHGAAGVIVALPAGVAIAGEVVSVNLPLTNSSEDEVIFESYRASCGCMTLNRSGNTAAFPITITPGDTQHYTISINTTGKNGESVFVVDLLGRRGGDEFGQTFNINMNIRPAWVIEPASLRFSGVEPGDIMSAQLVVYDGAKDHILDIEQIATTDDDRIRVSRDISAGEPLVLGDGGARNTFTRRFTLDVSYTVPTNEETNDHISISGLNSQVVCKVPITCRLKQPRHMIRPKELVYTTASHEPGATRVAWLITSFLAALPSVVTPHAGIDVDISQAGNASASKGNSPERQLYKLSVRLTDGIDGVFAESSRIPIELSLGDESIILWVSCVE